MSSSRLRAGALLLAAFAWLAATAWVRPLMAPDEGRYIGIAFQMLQSGDWLVPRLNGLPFFHKPPLFYWLSAAAMQVLGASEWAGRLPSMLGATLAAGALFLFLRRWSGERGARLSVVVLVTMPFFYIGAQFGNLDMLVAGCIGATVLASAHAALAREQGSAYRGALMAAFVFAALGVLAKGLIGLVLPGLVFLVWCGATHRWRSLRLVAWLPGWAVFLLVGAPWFVAMQMRYAGFFNYFFVTQQFTRFSASGFNNEQAFWFYLPVIAVLALPWIGWLAWRLARRGQRASPSDVDWLMWIWCASILAFFSIPHSKLIGYVLPALPPLAYLVASAVMATVGNAAERLSSAALRWTAGSAALVCIAAVLLVGHLATPPDARLRLPAGERIEPGDQILMLDAYYYEIPFYWRLRRPVMVSGDWSAAALVEDNWPQELAEAARFEPQRRAATLIDRGSVRQVLCVPRTTWLVGPTNAQLANPWLDLTKFRLIAYTTKVAVWKFAGHAEGDAPCLGTPAMPPPNALAAP